MTTPLKKTPPQLRCDETTRAVPLSLSCNLATLQPAALAAFVSASIERADELAGHVPENRREEYQTAVRNACAELTAASKITGGAAAITSHTSIVQAGGHFGAALAHLVTAGNVVRQSLEINDSPFVSGLANRVQSIAARATKGGTNARH